MRFQVSWITRLTANLRCRCIRIPSFCYIQISANTWKILPQTISPLRKCSISAKSLLWSDGARTKGITIIATNSLHMIQHQYTVQLHRSEVFHNIHQQNRTLMTGSKRTIQSHQKTIPILPNPYFITSRLLKDSMTGLNWLSAPSDESSSLEVWASEVDIYWLHFWFLLCSHPPSDHHGTWWKS